MKGTSTATQLCVCVCEELNFTYSSLKSSLPALSLSLLFNASTWRMSDLYARTKLQINLLKMIVKAVRCAGVYFQHPTPALSPSLSLSACLFPLLSLARSVCSCMQEFLRKNIDDLANVHWKGKIHWAAAIRMAGSLVHCAWQQLPVGIYLLPVAKHLTSWLMSSRNRFPTTVQNMKNVLVKRNCNRIEQKHEQATGM